jgi:hypothetical protein
MSFGVGLDIASAAPPPEAMNLQQQHARGAT